MSRRGWTSVLIAGAVALVVSVGVLSYTDNSSSSDASASATTSSSTTTSTSATAGSAPALGVSGQVAGAGASSQQAAQEAWIAAFQTANPNVTISYDPVGSGGGREQFTAGAVVYGASDVPLEGEEFTKGQDRCGGADNLIEAPVYVSPIAVVVNLSGIERMQLDPGTIASIFAGKITKWDDPAIARTNPGVTLPDTTITPVHRSDKSGTTENFTHYLSATAPAVWTYEPSGEWPLSGGEAAQGTSGLIAAVKAGDGTIGYADESQAGSLTKAAVKVGDSFVEPSAEAAGKIFAASKETSEPGKHVYTYDIDYTTSAAGTYPIVLVSYMLACTKYSNANDAEIVQGYLGYVASPAGQAAAANAAGSAPIPPTVDQQIQAAAAAIQTS
jgi:phosphate transport system substrate-binding protein